MPTRGMSVARCAAGALNAGPRLRSGRRRRVRSTAPSPDRGRGLHVGCAGRRASGSNHTSRCVRVRAIRPGRSTNSSMPMPVWRRSQRYTARVQPRPHRVSRIGEARGYAPTRSRTGSSFRTARASSTRATTCCATACGARSASCSSHASYPSRRRMLSTKPMPPASVARRPGQAAGMTRSGGPSGPGDRAAPSSERDAVGSSTSVLGTSWAPGDTVDAAGTGPRAVGSASAASAPREAPSRSSAGSVWCARAAPTGPSAAVGDFASPPYPDGADPRRGESAASCAAEARKTAATNRRASLVAGSPGDAPRAAGREGAPTDDTSR